MPPSTASHLGVYAEFGDEQLLLTHVCGEERISEPFLYHLELLTEDHVPVIKAKDVVGKKISFSISNRADEPRYFTAYVRRFVYWGRDDRHKHYRAEVVPRLWFLSRRSTSRIFQNKSVVDIITDVLDEHGLSDHRWELNTQYPPREYCVQYQETDLNFVTRLLEEEGIFYFFEHDQTALEPNAVGRHTLVLGDHRGAYAAAAEGRVQFHSNLSAHHDDDPIRSWEQSHEFITGNFVQRDFNFKTPTDPLERSVPSVIDLDGIDQYEQYEFPGGFGYPDGPEPDANTAAVERWDELSERRMQKEEVRFAQIVGSGLCVSFAPGHTFTMEYNHLTEEEDKTYLLLSVRHDADARGAYASGTETPSENGTVYRNEFTCMPGDVIFRPARSTPRAKVSGAQTATVVGPEGEIVYPDQYGRVKVKFHWDRAGGADDSSSCWVRVSQNWAGSNWGGLNLPHVGQEVIVEFIEGDPSRPIIIGRVYNAANMPPVELPDSKERTIFRDRFGNEMAFDSREGNEHMYIYSPNQRSAIVLGTGEHSGGDSVGAYPAALFGTSFRNKKGERKFDGVALHTQGDFVKYVEGNEADAKKGDTFGFHFGSKLEGIIGFKMDVALAAKVEAFIGPKLALDVSVGVELAFADKVKFSKGEEMKYGTKKYRHHVKDDARINSNGELLLIGGDRDQSFVAANKDKVIIQHGSATLPSTLNDETDRMWAVGAMAVLGTALTLVLSNPFDEKFGEEGKGKLKDGGAIAAVGVMAGLSAVLGLIPGFASLFESESRRTASDLHPDANIKSKIELDAGGVEIKAGTQSCMKVKQADGITIQSDDKSVKIKGQTGIELETNCTLEVKANLVNIPGGTVKHKNITVLE
jgi:type VI secretion system secreted protein VgrG